MYSAHNEYISDPRYTWAIDTEAPLGGSALPLSVEFFRDVFRNGSKAQMRMFEQDFLCTYGATTNLTNGPHSLSRLCFLCRRCTADGGVVCPAGDVSTGMQWFNAMGNMVILSRLACCLCLANPESNTRHRRARGECDPADLHGVPGPYTREHGAACRHECARHQRQRPQQPG